jgi:hypothetical protein
MENEDEIVRKVVLSAVFSAYYDNTIIIQEELI